MIVGELRGRGAGVIYGVGADLRACVIGAGGGGVEGVVEWNRRVRLAWYSTLARAAAVVIQVGVIYRG